MDIQSLPQCPPLVDARKGWGEKDGHGCQPEYCLRDFGVIALWVGIGLILTFPLTAFGFHVKHEVLIRQFFSPLLPLGEEPETVDGIWPKMLK